MTIAPMPLYVFYSVNTSCSKEHNCTHLHPSPDTSSTSSPFMIYSEGKWMVKFYGASFHWRRRYSMCFQWDSFTKVWHRHGRWSKTGMQVGHVSPPRATKPSPPCLWLTACQFMEANAPIHINVSFDTLRQRQLNQPLETTTSPFPAGSCKSRL